MISQSNIYQMLLYAFKLWGSEKYIKSSKQSLDSPLDVLASILAHQTVIADRRGLHRDYIVTRERSFQPKGKILLSETIKLRAGGANEVWIEDSELSPNNEVNQNIGWGLKFLYESKNISPYTKEFIRQSLQRFNSIDIPSYPTRTLEKAIIEVRRPEYKVALSIVSLLKGSFQLNVGEAENIRAYVPESEQIIMSSLFENFVREFYRYHLKNHKVSGRNMKWSISYQAIEPIMRTDINIESDSSILVIDTKYYKQPLTSRQDFGNIENKKIRSNNLYQIFTYLAYSSYLNPSKHHAGLLLYPENKKSINHTVKSIHGDIRIKTVNFEEDWRKVESNLLDLVNS
ncbi:hypothetical protein N9E57_01765 [Gammaproteobacteria bacterium]|nr:hypothetical protein [Gammaproteobacteria bacterium]